MNDTEQIRILIVDDHALVREGLQSVISAEADMQVVGEAADGVSAVQQAYDLKPDVILMDMIMPGQNGLEALQQLKHENFPARIIVLAAFADDQKIFPAIKAGAQGYLLKDILPDQLLQAIRDVHRGESSLHPTIARQVMAELIRDPASPVAAQALTAREVDVLKLIAQGYSNQEIGEELVLSKGTVGKHVTSILEKLHLANRTQAALYALREGLAPLNPEPD
ncbi:MAG: LuxR family transcriptional regulator [Desulfobacterales bacterium SG8_35_2]|jgi:NarL family two-component system response regulator LiaR|nr:MAG: LuxR family transcriptional regulator [Desulfobacterales bacterium SG8_35_2]